MYNGLLRPYLSSKGPYNNCPNEMPTKKLESERPILATVVCRSPAIAGKPGKYMSIEKGLIVESAPRIRMMMEYCLRDIERCKIRGIVIL